MARSFRSRRFRRSARRYAARRRRGSSLGRIKKDIQKCNFPTKVKFMGLTERKVMFLTKNMSMEFTKRDDNADVAKCIYLSPTFTENYKSIVEEDVTITTVRPPITEGGDNVVKNYNVRQPNWDKMCILGIYIKIQPTMNQFTVGTREIVPIKCIYSMNNADVEFAREYDIAIQPKKQIFTFNSNEAFTIYVPAPTTMEFGSSNVHKSKTWWSLADLKTFSTSIITRSGDGDEEDTFDEEDQDQDLPLLGDVLMANGNIMHAGRLTFITSGDASFNVTINYKVALKG